MGRSEQAVVFIVVVCSILFYLALRQMGPEPTFFVVTPAQTTVPLER